MLIGGMFDVDIGQVHKKPETKNFPFRFDTKHQYNRKVYTNNGRTATAYVFLHGMKLEKGARVLVPEYNCISVFNALEAVDAVFTVYRVKPGLIIDTQDLESKITPDCKVIYLIHYFGVPQPKEVTDEIIRIARKYNLYILEDLTQALLTKAEGRIGFGDYLVMSTRKWYAVTDGGVAAARDNVDFEVVEIPDGYDEAVYRQMLISLERKYYELELDRSIKEYLQLEREANKARYLDFTPKKMTEMSQNIFFHADHEYSVKRRRENYTYLYENLQNIAGLTIWGEPLDKEGNCVPFGFMVTVECRDEFYDFLAERRVIGEIQWILPEQYYKPDEYAEFLTRHSLMLQCDQRYGTREMEYTVQVILEYFEKK
ncbi:MAG: aminotransferase class V-fold PLP-dependent enzyme [Anaerocolumna sp.]